MDPEFREALDLLEERLRQHIDGTVEGLGARIRAEIVELSTEVRAEIRAGDAETRRHAGVLTEGLRSDFRIATEGIDALNQKFDALHGDHENTRRRVDMLEARVTVLERGPARGPGRRRRR